MGGVAWDRHAASCVSCCGFTSVELVIDLGSAWIPALRDLNVQVEATVQGMSQAGSGRATHRSCCWHSVGKFQDAGSPSVAPRLDLKLEVFGSSGEPASHACDGANLGHDARAALAVPGHARQLCGAGSTPGGRRTYGGSMVVPGVGNEQAYLHP